MLSKRTLAQELDYQREASNLLRIAGNLASFQRIVVPAPIQDYTSSRVLTMELVEGQKITSITPLLRQLRIGCAVRRQIAEFSDQRAKSQGRLVVPEVRCITHSLV